MLSRLFVFGTYKLQKFIEYIIIVYKITFLLLQKERAPTTRSTPVKQCRHYAGDFSAEFKCSAHLSFGTMPAEGHCHRDGLAIPLHSRHSRT